MAVLLMACVVCQTLTDVESDRLSTFKKESDSMFNQLFFRSDALTRQLPAPFVDLWAVVRIHVVAMKAPANDLARFGLGASAFAMGQRRVPLVTLLGERSVRLGRHRFRDSSFLFGCVLGTRAKFDRAIAVVLSFHRQTADTVALFAALPIVPGEIAEMSVAHSLRSPLMRQRPTGSASPAGRRARRWHD